MPNPLLPVLLILGASLALAQDKPEPAAPVPAPDTTEAAIASPDPGANAVPGAQDLAELVRSLAAEQRSLEAGGEQFAVFVKTITGGPAQGAIVLIPGDGQYPTASPGLEQLRQSLPAFGWSTWLISLESPPLAQFAQLAPATAVTTTGAADAASVDPKRPASEAPAGAEAAPAAVPVSAAAATAGAESSEQQRAAGLSEWVARSQARIASVIAAASAEGDVVLVAENAGAVLLSSLLAAQPTVAHAVVIIEPVDLPGHAERWPKDLATPVLELLSPSAYLAQAAERREQANALGLRYYRQIQLDGDGWVEGEGQALLAKRVRGWLKTLDQRESRRSSSE